MMKAETANIAQRISPAEMAASEWLTPAELAKRLNVSEATMRRNIHTDPNSEAPDGKLPGVRIGRQLRVHVDDLKKHEARERRQKAARLTRSFGSAGQVPDCFPNL